jgi:drug/metabolite transporter (DMT)-like permease
MNGTPPKLSGSETTHKTDRKIARILAILFSAIAIWILLGVVGNGLLSIFAGAPFIAAASLCWWFTLRGEHKKSRARMMYAFAGALIVGGIGFSVGFFGSIIFSPASNQGPLLGIFITGPLGFVLGAIIGTIVGCIRTRKIQN